MGDITDWMFESGMLDMPDGDDDVEDEYGGSPRSSRPFCKYCRSRSVSWVHTGVRWRLYDEHAKNLHVCRNVAKADEFDDLGPV